VVSWQANRDVCLHGPQDPELWRLCAVIAEAADADGHYAKVGQRLLMERCWVSSYGLRQLLAAAVAGGWLTVTKPGNGRAQTVYSLGDNFASARNSRANPISARNDAQLRTPSARFDAQNRARTVYEVRRSSKRAARPAKGGRALAPDQTLTPSAAPPPLHLSGSGVLVDWTAARHARDNNQNDG
jgi:hypothetical protein